MNKKWLYLLILILCNMLIFSGILPVHAQPNQNSLTAPNNPQQSSIIIDVERCKMLVFKGSQVVKTYTVGVGTKSTPSPIGNWKINFKAKNWGSGFGARFMGLDVTWGKYGIHGTNKPWSIGTRASHGCIRMMDTDVIELYSLVSVNTPVIIIGNPFEHLNFRPTLCEGHKGAQVVLLQKALQRLGYYKDSCDGNFGLGTEKALKMFQKDNGLEVTGQASVKVFELLRL